MSKPKILSTRPLFPAARTILNEHFEVDYYPDRIPRAELLKRIADKDGLICLLTEKVDEELLATAPKLRIAATVSVGYDNIDVPACTAAQSRRHQHARRARRHHRRFCLDAADGHRAAADRRRRLDALRHLARMGPRSACRRRRLGKDARHPRLRPHRPRGRAPRARIQHARSLQRRGARARGSRKRTSRRIRGSRPPVPRIRFHQRACPAACPKRAT